MYDLNYARIYGGHRIERSAMDVTIREIQKQESLFIKNTGALALEFPAKGKEK